MMPVSMYNKCTHAIIGMICRHWLVSVFYEVHRFKSGRVALWSCLGCRDCVQKSSISCAKPLFKNSIACTKSLTTGTLGSPENYARMCIIVMTTEIMMYKP